MGQDNTDNSVSFNIFKFVIKAQAYITTFLMGLFGLLLGYLMFHPTPNQSVVNSFLPIITGWIGVIIGFYFSREIGGIMEKKLNEAKEDVREEYEKASVKIADMERQIAEKDKTINDFKKLYKDMESGAGTAVTKIRDYYEGYINEIKQKKKTK